MTKSELEKLEAGEWYKVNDEEVAKRKLTAATLCQEFNTISENEPKKQELKREKSLVLLEKTWLFIVG